MFALERYFLALDNPDNNEEVKRKDAISQLWEIFTGEIWDKSI